MSLFEQRPVGSGSGAAAAVPALGEVGEVAPGLGVDSSVGAAEGLVTGSVGEVTVDCSALTGRAEGPPEEPVPWPPAPRTCASTNTRARGTARTTTRRVQYTRAGSGPRGRETAGMASR